MARKTKEEALVTRGRILDAAEQVFYRRGVSGSSLHEVAQQAGVTRGAVYWHFKDKADVFNAMMERVCLPMEEGPPRLGCDADPLTALRLHLHRIFELIVGDEQACRVFEIATQKVEFVDELVAVRERHQQACHEHVDELRHLIARAQELGVITAGKPALALAVGLHALLAGLIQNWLLDQAAFDLRTVGGLAVDTYLAGMAGPGLAVPPACQGAQLLKPQKA